MAMVKKVNTILNRVGTGITDPLDGIIDDKRVIIKTINNDEGNKVLINELVCYNIAKALNLPIPDGGICIIDDSTKLEQNITLSSERYGVGFYSNRLDKVTNITNSPLLIKNYIINKEDFLKIILFDNLVYNKDRHKGNMLMDIGKQQGNKIHIIDHSHVFNIGSLWDRYQLARMMNENDYNSSEVMDYNKNIYDLLIQAIDFSYEALNQEVQNFKMLLNEQFLQNIINTIPEEWECDEIEKNMLLNYIIYRLKNIENISNVIYNYIRK